MKALVIAPQPFFTPRGTPFSVYYRTMMLAEQGVDIDLLTYGEGQNVEIPGVRLLRGPRFAFLGNVKTGPSALKLLLDLFLMLRTIGLLLGNRYDFVHAHEEAVFFCRYLKPLFRFKLIYDMHSSLPQQLTNFNFTTSRSLINLFKSLEDSCLHSADAIITICPALAKYVDVLIENPAKHQLIENSIFDPVKLTNQTSVNGGDPSDNSDFPFVQEGGPLIVYAGTLEHYQGIDIMLAGFKLANGSNPDIRMIIAGGSAPQVDHYRERVRALGIEKACALIGRVPQATAKRLMHLATVLASPRIEGDNTPLKVYELLASGKPFFATNIYSHTQVLTDEVAFLVDPTAEGIAKGILDATSSINLVEQKIENARQLYKEKYSREAYKTKIQKLLSQLECAA